MVESFRELERLNFLVVSSFLVSDRAFVTLRDLDVNCPLSESKRASLFRGSPHRGLTSIPGSRVARRETNEHRAGKDEKGERERGGSKEILIKPLCVWVDARSRVCVHPRAGASSSAVNYTYGFHYRTSLLRNRKPRRLSRPPRCFPERRGGIDILPIARAIGRRRGDEATAKVT